MSIPAYQTNLSQPAPVGRSHRRRATTAEAPAGEAVATDKPGGRSAAARAGGIFFLVNNRAGATDEATIRSVAEATMIESPQRWDLFVRTRKDEDRVEIARQAVADGYSTIVAVGGDGTVSKVANALAGTDAILGIVPTGTANLVARALDIPLDVPGAMRLIAQGGPIRAVDGMRVNGMTFFSHVSAGVYSRITKKEGRTAKKLFGRSVYLWQVFRELAGGSRWNFDLELDDRRMSVRASIVMAANVAATGLGSIQWGQHIDPGNRGLDICIVKARSISQYLGLLADAARGRQYRSPYIQYERVERRFRISGPSNMPIRGDGRKIGKGEVTIELAPRTLNVIAPARSDQIA